MIPTASNPSARILGTVAAVAAFAWVPTIAQSNDAELRFEVASIRRHVETGSSQSGIDDKPSLVRIDNLTLRALIRVAYGVMDRQVAGPKWLDRVTFDIAAKPPADYRPGQLPVLLRNLLADRFGLVTHRERKRVDGFALQALASGHRLTNATGERTFLTGRPGLIAGNRRTMTELADLLAQQVGAPVIDHTGLTGAYDIRLEWSPPRSAAATDPELSIFTALREQLGLRLTPIKTPVDVVVVDRIHEQPTEN